MPAGHLQLVSQQKQCEQRLIVLEGSHGMLQRLPGGMLALQTVSVSLQPFAAGLSSSEQWNSGNKLKSRRVYHHKKKGAGPV
jgi:hypothetical protein